MLAGTAAHADITLDVNFSGPDEYTPGLTADDPAIDEYTLSIQNSGDMVESDVRGLTALPDGATVTIASCAEVGSDTSCNARIQDGQLDTTASPPGAAR